jgi:hypothetical protein
MERGESLMEKKETMLTSFRGWRNEFDDENRSMIARLRKSSRDSANQGPDLCRARDGVYISDKRRILYLEIITASCS